MFRLVIIVLAFSCCVGSSCVAGDGDLQYRWDTGDDFAYEVTIEVDKPTEKLTYEGMIRYHVDQSSDDWSQVTFRGGTRKQSRPKGNKELGGSRAGFPGFGSSGISGPGNRGPGFGGPNFGGPGGRDPKDWRPSDIVIDVGTIPGPFAQKEFAGTSLSTSKITLSPSGEALAIEGDSQMPHLIGNLSLLPFEPFLDAEDHPGNQQKKSWQVKGKVAVGKSGRDRRSMFPGMFGRGEPMEVRTATEETNFRLTQTDGQLQRFNKSYSLTAPPIGDKPAYSIKGEGTWVFDSERRLPHSLAFTQTLQTEANNVLVRVPIKISYKLLSAKRTAEIIRDETERREKYARDSAEKKRQQETPLTADEKQQALQTLVAGSNSDVVGVLNKLAIKKPENPDAAIVSAIEKRLHDDSSSVAKSAHRAMMAWSRRYSDEYKINQKYHERRSSVDSTGRSVSSTDQLYVGQIVQARDRGTFWYAAEVIKLVSANRVLVKIRGGARKEVVLYIDNIQLAPDLVRQPAGRSKSARRSAMTQTQARSDAPWIDNTGKHKIVADFIELSGGSVSLKKADGEEIKVPLKRLSDKDQRRAVELQAKLETGKALSDNPFE